MSIDKALSSTWEPQHLRLLASKITPWLRAVAAKDPLDVPVAEDVIVALHAAADELGRWVPPVVPVSAKAARILAAFQAAPILDIRPPAIEEEDRIAAIEARIASVRLLLAGSQSGRMPERYKAAVLLQDVIAQAVAARQALTTPLQAAGE